MKKKSIALLLAAALALSLSACGGEAAATPDPHAGMVYVNTGGGFEWIYPAQGVPVSDFSAADFSVSEDGRVAYTGDAYTTRLGVDVSFYQGEVDWAAVAASGVQFAMIRCGYRGATEGQLFEDETFRQNMEGALAAGLAVGVYFFSQSTGAVEAAEEANYVLALIRDYDVTMPVVFDWEPLDDSRSSDVDTDALTASAVVFCEMVKDAGYQPCVYFYRTLAYHDYDLTRLTGYQLWVGAPGDAPDFYYAHSMWQFSFTGSVNGIAGEVDLDLAFAPKAAETAAPSPAPTA